MSPAQAAASARRHVARLQLPADLGGAQVLLTNYDDEDTLRFMKAEEPDLTLPIQHALNAAFAAEITRRNGRVRLIPVNIADYFAWLGRHLLSNTPANRAQYISWLTCPEPRFTPQEPA